MLSFFGIQLAGAVAVPVNTRFAPPEPGGKILKRALRKTTTWEAPLR